MARIVMKGFLAKGATSFVDVETLLFQMKKVACDAAGRSYSRMVRRETERLVDEITLGRMKRPERDAILDVAAAIVRDKAICAERGSHPTEYCLYAGVQVLSGTVGKTPSTYFKLVAPNDVFSKPLSKIPDLIPYDATETELKKAANEERPGEKGKFFRSLMEKYDSVAPLVCPLVDYDQVSFSPEKLAFSSREKRAERIAREQVFNHLLSCYAMDREIPPEKLAEYVAYAWARMETDEAKEAVEEEKGRLVNLLPEITLDLVTKFGPIPIDSNAPSQDAGEEPSSADEEGSRDAGGESARAREDAGEAESGECAARDEGKAADARDDSDVSDAQGDASDQDDAGSSEKMIENS